MAWAPSTCHEFSNPCLMRWRPSRTRVNAVPCAAHLRERFPDCVRAARGLESLRREAVGDLAGDDVKTRDVEIPITPPPDLTLHTGPNWTAVIFFAVLSLLHFAIALPAFAKHRWEGYLSLFFATAFVGAALVSYRARCEIAILPRQRRIRLRSGLKRLHLQRYIEFNEVHGVRLTFSNPSGRGESRIELLCDNEDIECPSTHVPRQEALCLAMLLGVRLIKVCPDGTPEPDVTPRF